MNKIAPISWGCPYSTEGGGYVLRGVLLPPKRLSPKFYVPTDGQHTIAVESDRRILYHGSSVD